MALSDLVLRVRNALAVGSDRDVEIEAGVKAAGRRLLTDYNFPKQVNKQVELSAAAGLDSWTLAAGFKRVLGVRLRQPESGKVYWSDPLMRAEGFVLPSANGMPMYYWLEGLKLWVNSPIPVATPQPDVYIWYQDKSWAYNEAWLLSDLEDALFYFAVTRLSAEMRKAEVMNAFAPLWADERQSLAIYLNELEWDDVTIHMREAVDGGSIRYR